MLHSLILTGLSYKPTGKYNCNQDSQKLTHSREKEFNGSRTYIKHFKRKRE